MTIATLTTRADCRLCASVDLRLVLSLSPTPLANHFVTAAQRGVPQPSFPLNVHLCESCGHVQLRDVVDPQILFRDYVYVSSTSPVFVDHFHRYAEAMIEKTNMSKGSLVVEIGSNDGTLLRFFQESGMQVLGIDPAVEIAHKATQSGVPTLPEFFDLRLAHRLREEGWGAHLVSANNVFAHIDDLNGVVEGVACILEPDGIFTFEVSYLLDVVEKTLFDTIYHEHLSYHSVKPLLPFFDRHGMELIDAVRVDTHGGSLRGVAQLKGAPFPSAPGVVDRIKEENRAQLDAVETYEEFLENLLERKRELLRVLDEGRAAGRRLAAFGAPAKATTLMHFFGLGPELIDYVVDDSPLKQSLFTPGHHIPVVPSSYLYEESTKPDDLLVLAWNFAEPIRQKHRAFVEAGGRFIVPLPRVEAHTSP